MISRIFSPFLFAKPQNSRTFAPQFGTDEANAKQKSTVRYSSSVVMQSPLSLT